MPLGEIENSFYISNNIEDDEKIFDNKEDNNQQISEELSEKINDEKKLFSVFIIVIFRIYQKKLRMKK